MRTIGSRHRRKQTTEGEARPTMVAITDGDHNVTIELPDDTAELDFARGIFPVEHRPVEGEEDISSYAPRHCRWRLLRRDVDVTTLVPHHLRRREDGRVEQCTHVPIRFDGLRAEDRVAMVMGGSGDRFASALSRRGEDVGATVYRTPPFALKDGRGQTDKDLDHLTLIRLLEETLTRPVEQRRFYLMRRRDRAVIAVKEAFQLRQDALKARIACEQRILQRLVGQIFLSETGLYPEGRIEDQADATKANDRILQLMIEAEAEQDRQLARAVEELDVYGAVFRQVRGCGPRIAAGIISAIGSIQRFVVYPDTVHLQQLRSERDRLLVEGRFSEDQDKIVDRVTEETTYFQQVQMVRSWKRENGQEEEARILDQALQNFKQIHRLKRKARQKGANKLKKFCGVHVLPDGTFPRRRAGVVANWNGLARQSLYLLADQFNRNPSSTWGQKLLENKLRLREKHPDEVVNGDGKRKYTNGHIHKMAIWRTLSRFVEWLFREWTRFEERQASQPAVPVS